MRINCGSVALDEHVHQMSPSSDIGVVNEQEAELSFHVSSCELI